MSSVNMPPTRSERLRSASQKDDDDDADDEETLDDEELWEDLSDDVFLTHTEPRVQIELHKNVAICLGEVIFMTLCLQGNRLMTLISQSGGIQIHYAT